MDEQAASDLSRSDLAASLRLLETAITRLRAAQMELIREADRRQAPSADGCRSLQEWTAGRLDVSTETAAALVRTARALEELPHLAMAVSDGRMSLDRSLEITRLASPDDELDVMLECEALDIGGIRRRAAMRHRTSRRAERKAFTGRHVVLQPNLDESRWRMAGVLPGFVGSVVDRALVERGDALPDLPDRPLSRGQRNADALWAMAQDSLDGANDASNDRGAAMVTVFVDANEAAPTGGEAGVIIESGPRVGPETLEMILCGGRVEVTANAGDGTPVGVGATSRALPPRLRRFVLARDGACVADGCASRYRLQPHHVVPYAQRSEHDPRNLVALCWFHHHVVIHGHGYRLDPASPRSRLRFLHPTTPRSPP